jgi:hypothetical protein
MIQIHSHAPEGYVELHLDGKVDREGFERVAKELGELMDARAAAGEGRLGILKDIVSFGGIPPSVLWDDIQFGFRHLKHVGPVAVVSDKKWIEVWTKIAAPFWGSEVKYFDRDDLDEARAWLVGVMAGHTAAD